MSAIFFNALARMRGQILGWGLGLGLLGFYLMPFYDTLAEQQETLKQLLASYPPELMAFFGNTTVMFTPEGYLGFEYFSLMPVILGIFAVLAGSGLLVGDEESGTLDLVLAHPLSRTELFLGKLLGFIATTVGILILAWLGLVIGRNFSNIDLTAGQLAMPFLSLFGVLLLFGALALLLSMLLPSRRFTASLAGLLLVACYFVTSLARVDDRLIDLARFSPLNYYQSSDAMSNMNYTWIAGLLAAAALFAAVAWWRFERRDIRVGGEGGWRIPLPWRRAAPHNR
ncbi:MAG: ABC transporter permease subunit [Chloroflexi bacterium]|nr:ABC transporter permease subunit [Chloroflexota bacterium]MBI4315624.1 ABC transporter permease subunit [Chloroflexota bacterium]